MGKIQILTAALLLIHLSLGAQTSIRGRILDQEAKGLTGANIYLKGTYEGTSSDKAGFFVLESKEKGSQVLCVEFIGFKARTIPLFLDGKSLDLADIHLKEEVNELTAVTITAGTFEAGDKKKSISLSAIDMVTTDGSSGDVYGSLQALPGTTTVGESGRLFVKGGDSRESKTYIDGTLVYVPYSSSSPNQSVRGRFSPFMFSGMMFSTGGYSAEYGQALSSVLSLQTHAMPVEDQLNISLLSVGAEVGGSKTWDRFSLTSNLGYYNLGPYMNVVPQNTSFEMEPRSLSGDLGFRLRTGKSGLLKFYGTANRSSLVSLEENLDQPGSSLRYALINDHYYSNASWNGEVAKNWILSAGFSFTRNTDHISMDSTSMQIGLQGTHSKLSLKHRFSDRVRILGGAEWYSRSYSMNQPDSDSRFSLSYLNHSLSGFIEAELYASSRFMTRAGARYEYSDYLGCSSLAPRISTALKLGKAGQISLAYGWFFQDPEDQFLLLFPDLDYERADHYTLNYLMNHDSRMLRTEIYLKDYKNLVRYGWDPKAGPSPRSAGDYYRGTGQGYSFVNNSGDGYAYGLDIFWRDRKSIKGGEYWISYSYIESVRDYLDYPQEAIPAFTSKHNLSLVYKHFFTSLRSQLGTSYHYNSPRWYNNPNSAEFNSEKTKAFHSLNMNWSLLLKQHVIIYFTVSNVLGYEQEFGKSFGSRPDADGVYPSKLILPSAKRWILLGCFITLSRDGKINQLDKIN